MTGDGKHRGAGREAGGQGGAAPSWPAASSPPGYFGQEEGLRPRSEAELADLVAAAEAPLSVRGGGTRGMAGPGRALSLAGLTGIRLYEPGALTLVAAAGTALAEIEAVLAGENQRLAFEPMDHRGLLGTQGVPTLGGVVAGNVSGPRRIQAGAARDVVLGVRFVDGRGQVLRNGGRVMKNVTGYDLARLMAGSQGRLGVLTEVAMKVLPRPETEASLMLDIADVGRAVRAMSAALGTPFEVSGAAQDPAEGRVWLRLEGTAAQVAYRVEALRAALAGFGGGDVLGADASGALWRELRDVAPFQGALGDVWRVSVRPSQAAALVARAGAEAVLLEWGGGLIWLRMAPGSDLRSRLGHYDGHATLVRASAADLDRLGRLQPPEAAVAALEAGLQARFDPRGILGGGRQRPAAAV